MSNATEAKMGGGAFPTDGAYAGYREGMTLLDYFAGQALAGMLARPDFVLFCDGGEGLNVELSAHNAYEIARAMLAERKK